MAGKQTRAGGKRKRVGRPAGPPETVRRNRVVAFVTDAELSKLHRISDERDLPMATVVYQLLVASLKRRK